MEQAEEDQEEVPLWAGECQAVKRRPATTGPDCHDACHPLATQGGEGNEEAPLCAPCLSPWVQDELQSMQELSTATLPYHLVLEAARELPMEERRQLI